MKGARTTAGLAAATGLLAVSERWVSYPPWSWRAWTDAGPVMAIFQVARLMLLMAAGLGVLLLGAVWACDRLSWSRPLYHLGRLPLGRWAVRMVAGAAVAGSSVVAGGSAASATPPPGPAPVLVIEASGPHAGPLHHSRPPIAAQSKVTPGHRRTPARPSRRVATWRVQPGDNLWSIAETVLAEYAGEPASPQEVARYWLRVIDANRPRLPDPADPSLLFPGDMVMLPPPDRLSR